MKLNYRDKVILIAAIVILTWVAGIFLFIKPAIEGVNQAQDTLDKKKTELVDLKKKIKEQEDLPERIDKAYKEATEYSDNFYDFQSAQQATHTIDKKLADADLDNTNMTISAYTPTVLYPYVYQDPLQKTAADNQYEDYKNGNTKATDAAKNQQQNQSVVTYDDSDPSVLVTNKQKNGTGIVEIGVYNVDFTFTGKMDNIKKFCQDLVNDKSLIVTSLVVPDVENSEGKETKDGDKGAESTVTLQMVVLKKLQDPNKLEAQNK